MIWQTLYQKIKTAMLPMSPIDIRIEFFSLSAIDAACIADSAPEKER
jgi:hypothetical protein